MKLCFIVGGFAPIGGIEVSIADLLVDLRERIPERRLVYWGRAAGALPEMKRIVASGAVIRRSAWRWGSRWAWPDRIMAPMAGDFAAWADLIVFGKRFSPAIHQRLVHADGRIVRLEHGNAAQHTSR